MKNNINIKPTGLKGNEINERIKELMGISSINENKKTSVIELSKMGPDGNVYAIVRENHEYYIKSTSKQDNLVFEDFNYIGGLKNKKSEAYPSYAKAIKHLNLKFNSLAEAYNKTGNINVFENDNLVNEDVAGFSETKTNGFSGEGNLEGNKKMWGEGEEVAEEETVVESDEESLTEIEQAVDDMTKEKKVEVKESNKLSMIRALENMDGIIDGLTEGNVKKKVYTIK